MLRVLSRLIKKTRNRPAYRLQAGFFFVYLFHKTVVLLCCVVSDRNLPCLFDWIIAIMMIVNTLMTLRFKQTEIFSFLLILNLLITPPVSNTIFLSGNLYFKSPRFTPLSFITSLSGVPRSHLKQSGKGIGLNGVVI